MMNKATTPSFVDAVGPLSRRDSDGRLVIDGSQGEGGGQVLRSSLSLALCTGESFSIENIRAGRKKPGLLRQHKTCVQAAAQIGCAEVHGAELGSRALVFRPGAVNHGRYHFSVGSAGSAMLVLQTVLPPLLVAEGRSEIVLEGGTHNPFAPPFDFLARVFVPALQRMGAQVSLRLERHGFFPAGGGRAVVVVEGGTLSPTTFVERSEVTLRGRAVVANLPRKIGDRELRVLRNALALERAATTVEEVDSVGPGNVVMVEATFAEGSELFAAFGERRLSAERVAKRAADAVSEWLEHGAPVGEHMADQLLLPLALAGGGAFTTGPLSLHALTNMEVIRAFLPETLFDVRVDERRTHVRVRQTSPKSGQR